MPASVGNSTALRTAIQNVVGTDPIINLNTATTYGITTLAKLPSNNAEPALPYSGYTIQSSAALTPPSQGSSTTTQLTRKFSNTRIYQQNIDGPNSPGILKDVELTYTFVSDIDALLSATTGSFSLTNVRITGEHRGWSGNGNLYFSLTSFNAAAPISVPLTLANVTINIDRQNNNFNGTDGGSAFLHSWNNIGPVSITNSSFDESGFASTLNLLGTDASPTGTYRITNNLFTRTVVARRTVRPEGNRLQNVNATLSGNTFNQGSYLDLYGDISGITLGAVSTTNTFTTIANGFGIRVTAPNTVAAPTLLGTNAFTGTGLPLKYVNATSNAGYRLTGGIITVAGTSFVNLIAGGQGDDVISGTANPDWINGDDGNDSISGLAGIDSILGGAGNDTIEGGLDGDTLNGGTGTDTLSYANSSAAVTVDLSTNTASGGDAQGDVISLFENLTGSANADTLTGSTAANLITGGAGTDSINGNSGNDTIEGGADADTLDGALGTDTLSYASSSAAVTVNLSTNSASGGDAQGDVISNFENLTGSANADTLTGTTGVNLIIGGAGTDSINGNSGNDTIEGGADADTLNGAIGTDTLSYASSSAAVTVNLSTNSASGGDAQGDVISNFENLIGSANADTLTGTATANFIYGRAGNDTLTGGGGVDRFYFDTTLNASTNIDTITDFNTSGADKIYLDNAIFTGLATGALAATDFGALAAVGADVVYTGGSLYFAAGGAATLAEYIQFATLTGSPAVINTDIVVF
jgi:Ca2+-binding RTX toxin-like protein